MVLEETLFQKGFFQEDFFCPATIYLKIYSYTLNGLKLNFLDRITGLAGLDLNSVYPVILSE
jgi:hypothetical protein